MCNNDASVFDSFRVDITWLPGNRNIRDNCGDGDGDDDNDGEDDGDGRVIKATTAVTMTKAATATKASRRAARSP